MSDSSKPKQKTRFEKNIAIVTVLLSIATAYLGFKTFQLNDKTSRTGAEIKRVEAQLKEDRLGFDRVRDVYDRTNEYLTSEQNARQGAALLALISVIPEPEVRTHFLSVVTAGTTNETIALEAATSYANEKLKLDSVGNSEFIGELKLDFSDNNRTATLVNEFGFKDSKGIVWMAPKGTITDGASIPSLFYSVAGTPFDNQLIKAAVIHDHYTSTMERPYNSTHTMFYEALLASGVSETKAKIFYAALQSAGAKWKDPA